MRHLAVLLTFLTLSFAQDYVVEVRGVGTDRQSAIQDALRRAVGQALGTQVQAVTQVENYMLLKDVIQTRTQGYIRRYNVIEETPFPDRYEVRIRAIVSVAPLKQDAQALAQWLGGLRFMVVYDPQGKKQQELEYYDYAYERMNEYLSRHNYRYIERSVFDRLKNEAVAISGQNNLSDEDYAKKLAFYADAEFLIFIRNIDIRVEERALGVRSVTATLEIKSYDNSTAEGLGTVVGESDPVLSQNEEEAIKKAIDGAIYNAAEKLMHTVLRYLANWCNNGAPFVLRFYGTTYKTMRGLKKKIIDDPDFGGQSEIVAAGGYVEMKGITFKKTATELVDKIFDYAENTPGFENMDLKLLYGRQASFALPGVRVPEAEEKQKVSQILPEVKKK